MSDRIYDVVVVGAGIMGSSAAAYAASEGAKVLLIEQFHLLHRRGSSHGESRIIRRTYPSQFYTHLMANSYKLWREAERESGMRVLVETGGIDVVKKTQPTYAALVKACASHDVAIEEITAAELKSRYQLDFSEEHVGVLQANSGILHATTAVAMYQSLAIKHGAELRDNAKVICRSSVTSDGVPLERLDLADGSAVFGKKIVFTCGPWAEPVLRGLCNLTLPLQVWQTSVMYFKPKDGVLNSSQLLQQLPVLIDYGVSPLWTSSTGALSDGTPEEPSIYSCPSKEFPGLIKFAVHRGTNVTADTRTYEPAKTETVDPVTKWLELHVPFLDPSPVSLDTCLYTMSPDEDFIIDFHPTNMNVIVAAGFSGHGFKFGSLVGRILADLAVVGCTKYDITPFSAQRASLKL